MRLFLRFLSFLRPYRWSLVLAFALVVVSTGLVVLSGYILNHILQQFKEWSDISAAGYRQGELPAFTRGVLMDALLWGGAAILATLVQALVSAWRAVIAGTASQRVVFDIRNRMVQHLTTLSLPFFEKHPTGQLMSRATSDVDSLQLLVTSATVDFLADIVQVVILGAVLLWISPKLALAALALAPLMLGGTALFGRRMRQVSREMQAQLAVVAAQLLETLSGIRVVMGFNAEQREQRRFYHENARTLRLGIKRLWLQNLWSASVECSVWVAVVALGVVGLREVIRGNMDVGKLGMFFYLLLRIPLPLQRLSIFADTLQRGLAAAERVFEILDTPAQVRSELGARDAGRVSGSIRFEAVSFAYETGRPALSDVCLDIAPGATVALVGPSGAGKTTLANLLVRFYDPTEGRIVVDGTDIRAWTLGSWRRQIGLVLQDTFLFSGTVGDNIAIGRKNATEAEIHAAARAANADEFIERLPEGYDTPVGERGVRLSGGQRQRIAIARAILRDPPILVLDEATSSLDSESERLIQGALDRLMEGRTAVVIAHRLSTIQRADEIVVLDMGRIVERGTHEGLMARNGLYARLYLTQFEAPTQKRPYVGPQLADLGADEPAR